MYAVHITDLAKAEFRKVVSYIVKELKAPQAADSLAKETEHRIKLLEEHPFKFPLVQDALLAERGMRFFPIKNYLAFYVVNEKKKKVSIVRFMYSHRDWLKLLA